MGPGLVSSSQRSLVDAGQWWRISQRGRFRLLDERSLFGGPKIPPYRPSNIRLGMNGSSRASLREESDTEHAIERSLPMRTATRTLAVLAGAKMLL